MNPTSRALFAFACVGLPFWWALTFSPVAWSQSSDIANSEYVREIGTRINSLRKSGKGDSAVVVIDAAIETARFKDDAPMERILLVKKAQLFHRLGRVLAAGELLEETIVLCEAASDTVGLFEALSIYATTLEDRGQASRVVEVAGRARDLAQTAGMVGREGAAMTQLARRSLRAGDLDRAQALIEESLPLLRAGGRARSAASSLNLLAICEGRRGNELESQRWLRACIEACRDIDLPRIEASALNNLGGSEMRVGDPAVAVEYFRRAYELKVQIGDARGAITPACNLALAMQELGRIDEARAIYETQSKVAADQGYRDLEVMLLNSLGALNIESGRHQEARSQLETSLEQARSLGNIGREMRAFTLLTRDHAEQGEPAVALALLEEHGPRLLAKSSAEDSVHLASVRGKALMAEQRYADAIPVLTTVARRHAELGDRRRQVKALGRLARCQVATGRSPDAIGTLRGAIGVWEEDRGSSFDPAWRESRGETGAFVYPLLATLILETANEPSESEVVGRAFDAVKFFKARTLLERIQDPEDSTAVASVLGHHIIGLSELQQDLLRHDEVYVDVLLGPDTSVLFVVSREQVRAIRLPGTEDGLEDRLRLLHELLSQVPQGRDPKIIEAIDRASERLDSELLADERAFVLAAKRIVYCPDGLLNLLPFPFTIPNEEEAADVVRVPSASVFASIRGASNSGKLIPEQTGLDESPAPHVLALAGGRSESGEPLPGSIREVRSLSRKFHAVDSELEAPSGSQTLSSRLEPYNVLHLSGHARIDDQRPWRSGLLLRPGSDTPYLRASTIAGLPLSADLAVLSSCQSAGGRIVAGEGILGLTTAFVCAGVPTVVAALWPVDDRATEQLVAHFYDELSNGRNVGQALRRAQSHLRAQDQYRHPFFWTGFVVVGEGETTVQLERKTLGTGPLWIAALLLVAGIGSRLGRSLRTRA